jgi:acetyl-CoA C-acetyltransferase
VAGAEARATQRTAKQNGEKLDWSYPPAEKRPFPYEGLPDKTEAAHELYHAWETFALWDNARRARLGTQMRAYERQTGAMMAPMTRVAAANEHAWRPRERSADELGVATADNRYIGFPHTRNEVSVIDVDMAAAVILATDEVADELGVSQDKRIYLTGWAYAKDPEVVSAREDMSRSVAMKLAFDAALGMAGTTTPKLGAFDLYSCFPSALNLACDALGLDPLDERGLTVTGGLPFAGGPSSCYMIHSIASMVDTLRTTGGTGLVTGVGMHMTKHVAAIYSSERPVRTTPVDGAALQAKADEQPLRPILSGVEGEGTVVAYTLTCDRDNNPTRGIVVVDLPDGRALARVHDSGLLADAIEHELVGRTVKISTSDGVNSATW